MVAFQIEEQMKQAGSLGSEFERMATVANIAPDLRMKKATGQTVGPETLLAATERAIRRVGRKD